jgi:hypothetical protein
MCPNTDQVQNIIFDLECALRMTQAPSPESASTKNVQDQGHFEPYHPSFKSRPFILLGD